MRIDIRNEGARTQWRRFVGFSHLLWILTLITMVLGPYVRAEDAGLACPDWPLCFGHVIPPYEYRVYLEFIHRAVAGFMGLVFLGWLFYLLTVQTIRTTFLPPALLALLLLVSQILLGGATVTELLDPYIVKSHLLNAILYLSVLLFIWKKARGILLGAGPLPASWNARLLQAAMLVLIFLQIFLGGRVSTNEVGLVCNDFPACYSQRVEENGETHLETVYRPSMADPAYEKHMTHRYMAYVLFLLAAYLFWSSRNTALFSRNGIFLALLCMQIMLGSTNVKWSLPVPITVLHSFTAIVLYMVAFLNLLEMKFHEPSV